MPYAIAPIARNDLLEIWFHVAKDRPEAADRLVDSFYERFVLLSEHPLLGELRSDLGDQIRQLSVGAYLLFYVPTDNGIRVIRVLHGSRDIPAIFQREKW